MRRERDSEREAHTSTTEALQSKIDLLVTQLARRDVELEYYATHTMRTQTPAFSPGHDAGNAVSSSVQSRPGPTEAKRTGLLSQAGRAGEQELGPATARSITNEEIIKMLSTTAARNRSLEVEIKTLFKRVNQFEVIHLCRPYKLMNHVFFFLFFHQLEQARSKSTSSPHASTSKARSSHSPRSPTRSRLGSTFTPPTKDDIVADGTSENWGRDVPDGSREYESDDRVDDAQRHHSHVHPPFTKGE